MAFNRAGRDAPSVRSLWIRPTPIVFTWRHSVTCTRRARTAEFIAQRTAARTGRRSSGTRKTRTMWAQSILLWTPGIRAHFTRRCGRRVVRHGRSTHLQICREAGSTNRQTVAIRGIHSRAASLPTSMLARLGSRLPRAISTASMRLWMIRAERLRVRCVVAAMRAMQPNLRAEYIALTMAAQRGRW